MLNVSKEFHQAFIDSEREVLARVSINGKVYPQNSVKSIDYSMGAFGGDSFQLGSTQSATVKILFTDIIEGLKELDEVKIEIGIKIRESGVPSTIENVSKLGHAKVGKAHLVTYVPDRFEFVPLGTFYISGRVDPDRNEQTTTIEARDGFLFMEDSYQSKLSYPAPLSSIALEIANQSGVSMDPISFNHLSTIRIGKPEGYTYRQAIGIIAQYQVGFASFDREGHLAIKQLSDPRFSIHPNEYFMKGLVKNELIYQPKGITCKVVQPKGESTETITLQAGSPNGAQINLENNTMTQTLLTQLFDQVKNINYYPINLKWRGNPALEVGDWVTMTDRKGKFFKSPILNYTLKFDGGLSGEISANSKAYSGNISVFKGPLQQKLDELDYRVDAAGKNNVYSGTEKPSNPKEGDIWFKKNGPDDEIWVYQQVSEGLFDWVMTTSTRMPEEIKERIENATPKDEIVKTINLSSEMNGKEWLKIKGAKLWLTDETKIDNAVITSAMIAEVDAGKIRAGTLDASQITVTNLNANSISTGTLSSINIIGVTIIGSTFETIGNQGKVIIKDGSMKFYDSGGLKFGDIKPTNEDRLGSGYGHKSMLLNSDCPIYIRSGEGRFNEGSYMYLAPAGGVDPNVFRSDIGFEFSWNTRTNLGRLGSFEMTNNTVSVGSGTYFKTDSVSSYGGGDVKFYNSINMNGNKVLNTSDIRLKEDIEDTKINGIEETKKLRFVEFNRKQNYLNKEPQKQPPKERELGLIAQYSPFLSVKSEEDNYLRIDMNKQIMLNSLTNKQLIKKIDNLADRINKLEKIGGNYGNRCTEIN